MMAEHDSLSPSKEKDAMDIAIEELTTQL